ncbi:MAG: PilZ domain-containing protein [Candidatus Latescibacteria bacterium]|mgnify:CR=1 FL=1|jgi:hypothetical protein|nr:PilZ domain-containing protein [Candidatus Latescibacterota bacterium]
MLRKWLGRLWNQREASTRVPTALVVDTLDCDGQPHTGETEDVSETGIRLRFQRADIAGLIGHRELVPQEIRLDPEGDPVAVQSRLVWAYNASDGGTVCGWQFLHYEEDAHDRLREFVERSDSDEA